MKVLLVDDDFFVRERVVCKTDWESLGITEVKTSQDGQTALETIRNFQPDILITDIRMPDMDGIRLAEEFCYRFPKAKVIFISGYAEVPYLRSAIRLRAAGYVEKPINVAELYATIQSTIHEIRREQDAGQAHDRLRENRVISEISQLTDALTREETLGKALEQLGTLIDLPKYRAYATALTRINRGEESKSFQEEELQRLTFDFAKGSGALCCCAAAGEHVLYQLLFGNENGWSRAEWQRFFERITGFFEEEGITCFHAAGTTVRKKEKWPDSYQKARAILPYGYFGTSGHVQYDTGEKPGPALKDLFASDAYMHAFQKNSDQDLIRLLDGVYQQLYQSSILLPADAIQFYYSILLQVLQELQKNNCELQGFFMTEYKLLHYLGSLPFYTDLHEYTLRIIREYYRNKENMYTPNKTVNLMISHMEQHYSDPDLSLSSIAEYARYSETYVSHLFKEVIGITVGEYLTKLRMERAKQLLDMGRYSVREVAARVGFRNSNYFSLKYRQTFGVSPSKDGMK